MEQTAKELFIGSDFFDERLVHSAGYGSLIVGNKEIACKIEQKYPCVVVISCENKEYACIVTRNVGGDCVVSFGGYDYPLEIFTTTERSYRQITGASEAAVNRAMKVSAPMPGLIKSATVSVGHKVKKGDTLFILEAMKMENSIKSPINGVISDVFVVAGEAVEKSHILCTIKP
ncbi:MAG: biotin/lipoyl-binding protein [Bacteroidetes bacterium]|nr:biotin/lipoyl-binding protein [Bacteroidota bacterium]